MGEFWHFVAWAGLAYHPGQTVNAYKTLSDTGGNDG